jgi:hypothetical protein
MAIDQSTTLEEILKRWSVTFTEGSKENSFGCEHEVKDYVGFAEQYEYCIKCDAKKINGEWQQAEKLKWFSDLF